MANWTSTDYGSTYEIDGEVLTRSEFWNKYFICECCKDAIPRTEPRIVTSDTDSTFCEDCADQELYHCDECGRYFADSDNGDYDNDDDCWICNSCNDNMPIKNYHTMKNHGQIQFYEADGESENREDTLHMGFELEVDNGNSRNICAKKLRDKFGKFYNYEYDGSLNEGFEIISNPASLKYHINNDFESLHKICRNFGFTSHEAGTCGLHVHIDKKYFGDKLDMCTAKLLYLFEKFWNPLYKFSRRKNDDWSAKYESKIKSVIKQMKAYKLGRYYAVNLTNANTIEIRLWRGTLNPQTFRATLKLTQRLVDIAKNCSATTIHDMSFEDVLGDDEDILAYWATRNSERANS